MAAGLQVDEGLDSLAQGINPGPFLERLNQEVSAWKRFSMNASGLPRS